MGQKRTSKTSRRHYKGEPEGSQLAAWLNGLPDEKPTASALKRIRGILAAFSAIRKRRKHPLAHLAGGSRLAYLAEISAAMRGHRYEVRPHLDQHGRYHAERKSIDFESWALRVISDLAERELEHRLRVCRHCQKWVYAHTNTQRFCPGGRCKKRFRESSKEYKAYHRKLAKRRYQIMHRR